MQQLADDSQLHLQDAVLILVVLSMLGLTLALQMAQQPALVIASLLDAMSEGADWLIHAARSVLA